MFIWRLRNKQTIISLHEELSYIWYVYRYLYHFDAYDLDERVLLGRIKSNTVRFVYIKSTIYATECEVFPSARFEYKLTSERNIFFLKEFITTCAFILTCAYRLNDKLYITLQKRWRFGANSFDFHTSELLRVLKPIYA